MKLKSQQLATEMEKMDALFAEIYSIRQQFAMMKFIGKTKHQYLRKAVQTRDLKACMLYFPSNV